LPLSVGSLFSGIGGLDLGLERAGMQVKWQVENDPYCVRVLEKHWPGVLRFNDVRELDPADLPPVDLVCGGFPCQPVSVAGQRKGQDDERWLWPDFARILRGVRPRYVLVENVPGLLARGVDDVLGDLAALGYDAEWESIPAAAFGAPHLRWRVFIVGHAECGGRSPKGAESDRTLSGAYAPQQKPGTPASASVQPDVADTDEERRRGRPGVFGEGRGAEPADGGWWSVEPDVGRVAYGVPARVDRLRALGNAVVPQVAEWVGRKIVEHAEA